MTTLIDLWSRLALLAAEAIVGSTALYYGFKIVHPGRRLVLLSMTLPCFAWVVFEVILLVNVTPTNGALSTPVWWSRFALFLTLVFFVIVQKTIVDTENLESNRRPTE